MFLYRHKRIFMYQNTNKYYLYQLYMHYQVQDLKKLPSLERSREEMVALLGHQQQRTTQLLQSNQQQLSTNLSQLIRDRSPPGDGEQDS